MSRPFSDGCDLRTLRPVPYDLAASPHRYASPAETQRLVDACLADDARGAADEAAFLHAHGFQWADADDDAPPPFCTPDFKCGLLWGVGLTASVGLLVAMAVLGPLLTAGGAK